MKHTLHLILLLALSAASAQTPNWRVTASDYEHSMNITGSVQLDVSEFASENDMIAAFVGEEVRGVVHPTFTGGRWLFFLTAHAHAAGDSLQFRYYNAMADTESELSERIVFEISAVKGTVSTPFMWTKGTSTSIGGGKSNYDLPQPSIYPNPFAHSTTISFHLPAPAVVTVDVFDLLGRKVLNLVTGHASAGEHTAVFEAGDLPNGLYIYRIEYEGYAVSKIITLIR